MQLELMQIEDEIQLPTLRSLSAGAAFKSKSKYYIKAKPVSFLLNSSLVSDALNRADCFIVDLVTGSLLVWEGEKRVEPIDMKAVLVK